MRKTAKKYNLRRRTKKQIQVKGGNNDNSRSTKRKPEKENEEMNHKKMKTEQMSKLKSTEILTKYLLERINIRELSDGLQNLSFEELFILNREMEKIQSSNIADFEKAKKAKEIIGVIFHVRQILQKPFVHNMQVSETHYAEFVKNSQNVITNFLPDDPFMVQQLHLMNLFQKMNRQYSLVEFIRQTPSFSSIYLNFLSNAVEDYRSFYKTVNYFVDYVQELLVKIYRYIDKENARNNMDDQNDPEYYMLEMDMAEIEGAAKRWSNEFTKHAYIQTFIQKYLTVNETMATDFKNVKNELVAETLSKIPVDVVQRVV